MPLLLLLPRLSLIFSILILLLLCFFFFFLFRICLWMERRISFSQKGRFSSLQHKEEEKSEEISLPSSSSFSFSLFHGRNDSPSLAEEEKKKKKKSVRTLVVLGSGGHTAEMLHLIEKFNQQVFQFFFLLASSDKTSFLQLSSSSFSSSLRDKKPSKDISLEGDKKRKKNESEREEREEDCLNVFSIPRSREVHQSFFSSFFSTLHALYRSFCLLSQIQPDLILVNGPGTCVPVVYAALLREAIFSPLKKDFSVIYIESICRVKSLSLSAFLLYPFLDRLLVQWPSLVGLYTKAEYYGRLY